MFYCSCAGIQWTVHTWCQSVYTAHATRRKAIVQCLLKDFNCVRYDDNKTEFLEECLPLLFDIFRHSKVRNWTYGYVKETNLQYWKCILHRFWGSVIVIGTGLQCLPMLCFPRLKRSGSTAIIVSGTFMLQLKMILIEFCIKLAWLVCIKVNINLFFFHRMR